MTMMPCPVCCRWFRRYNRVCGAPQIYCSRKCGQWMNSADLQARRATTRRLSRPQCETCGRTLSGSHRRYCSRECNQYAAGIVNQTSERCRVMWRDCRDCSTPFIRPYRRSLLCKRCAKANEEGRNRAKRLRRKGVLVGSYSREAIFERDGYRCHICRKQIPRRAKYPDPLSPSIDHLVPLSRGGEDEPANVAAAHVVCNSAKGAAACGEQLLLVG